MDFYMSNIKLSMQYRNLASQPGPPPSFLSLAVHISHLQLVMIREGNGNEITRNP